MMTPTFFDVPLILFRSGREVPLVLMTVGDAANFLFDNWTGHDSEKWGNAMNLCDAVASGASNVSDARLAFVLAVHAVGMRVELRHTLH